MRVRRHWIFSARPWLAIALVIVAVGASASTVEIQIPFSQTPIGTAWLMASGDSATWAQPGYDDSDWIQIGPYDPVILGAGDYAWLRTEFVLTEGDGGEKLYLFLGKIPGPTEVYLNGVLVASRGTMPPAYYVHIADPFELFLPTGQIEPGATNVIAVRVNYRGTQFAMTDASFGGQKEYRFVKDISELLNTRLYQAFTAILIVTGLFLILQFVFRKQEYRAFLFGLSCIFMAIYFYEIGSPRMLFTFWRMRGIAKASLLLSMSILTNFCMSHFELKARRVLRPVVYGIGVVCAGFLLAAPNESALEFTFKLCQVPAFLGVIYCFILLIQALIRKQRDLAAMAIGITIGFVLTIHDIVYSFSGVRPIAWFHGIGFFVMDLALFVALAIRTSRAFTALERYAEDLQIGRDHLARLNDSFARFVPNEFLRILGKDDVLDVELGDQVAKEMTILFSDMRSFTAISEKLTPAENFKFLNNYLASIVPIIREGKGIVDKYIGDAILVIFPETADLALNASIDMLTALRLYNLGRTRAGYPPVDIGIGLHTGPVILGTIGEHNRMDTTVISDVVNVASRLETFTKVIGANILVTGQVVSRVPDADSRYPLRYLSRVAVEGKESRVPIYEVIGERDAPGTLTKLETKAQFEEAATLLDDNRHQEAYRIFKYIATRNPDDGPAAYFVGLIERAERSRRAKAG